MRKWMMLLLTGLLLAGVMPLAAQDTPDNCWTLNSDDCALLQQAYAYTADLNSANLAIDGEISLVGLPDTPDMVITLNGSGAFDIDAAGVAALQADARMTEEVTLTDTVALMLDLFKNLNAELTVDMSVPGSLTGATGLFGQLNQKMLLDVKLVDGVGYVNFDGLDDISSGMLARQGFTGWGGLDFVALTEQLMDENAATVLLMDTLMRNQAAMQEQPRTDEIFNDYTTLERTDDGSGELAIFETTLDLEAVMRDEDMQRYMTNQLQSQQRGMTDAEAAQIVAMMQMLLGASEMGAVQHIDIASGQTVFTSYYFNMDFTMLMMLMGEDGAPKFNFRLDTTYSDFNNATVTAPAGARLADTDMVVDLLSGR